MATANDTDEIRQAGAAYWEISIKTHVCGIIYNEPLIYRLHLLISWTKHNLEMRVDNCYYYYYYVWAFRSVVYLLIVNRNGENRKADCFLRLKWGWVASKAVKRIRVGVCAPERADYCCETLLALIVDTMTRVINGLIPARHTQCAKIAGIPDIRKSFAFQRQHNIQPTPF